MRIEERGVTVKDRVLLHLLEYWGVPDRGEWPPGLTQAGIAAGVGITRGHVAVVLPELVRSGHVDARIDRVRGRARRVKVYTLTFKGGTTAGELARILLESTVTALDDTGEWDLPLDGLVQVHKVDMLTALASMDGRGRVDLRELRRSRAPTDSEAEEEDKEREALEAKPPVGAILEEVEAPARGDGPAQAVEAQPSLTPPMAAAPLHQPAYMAPPPAMVWNPVRWGSGRRPVPGGAGLVIAVGFLLTMGAVFFLGASAVEGGYVGCYVIGVFLLAFGSAITWSGTSQLWAVGSARPVWVTVILGAWGFMLSSVVAVIGWGSGALLDMLWVGAVMGGPSLLLAAGAGRAAAPRAAFLLLMGPVAAVAFVVTQLTDPSWAATGARAVLGVEVGASWALVGASMVRAEGRPERARLAYAGVAAGAVLGAVVRIVDDLTGARGDWRTDAVLALWAATGAWGLAAALVPGMRRWLPPASMAYPIVVFAASIGLLAAGVLFLEADLGTLGIALGAMAVAMVAMVSPEISRASRPEMLTIGWCGFVVGATVLVMLQGL